jgi:hypothetical protein
MDQTERPRSKTRDDLTTRLRTLSGDMQSEAYQSALRDLEAYDAQHPEEAEASRRRHRRHRVRAFRDKYHRVIVGSEWFCGCMILATLLMPMISKPARRRGSVRKELTLDQICPSFIPLGLLLVAVGVDVWLQFRFTDYPLTVRLLGPGIMLAGVIVATVGVVMMVQVH